MLRSHSTNQLLLAFAAVVVMALVALGPAASRGEAAQCAAANTPAFKLDGKAARKATLCVVNVERAKHGLGSLRFDDKQQQAAADHNRLMLKKNCFSHQCSGERDLVGRMDVAGYLPCNCAWSVGENLAWGSDETSSPRSIVDAWMGSSAHRINMMSSSFEEVGIGIDRGTPEGGGGDSATYTMTFGYKN